MPRRGRKAIEGGFEYKLTPDGKNFILKYPSGFKTIIKHNNESKLIADIAAAVKGKKP